MSGPAWSAAALSEPAVDPVDSHCIHCAQPLFSARFAPFCCAGCRSVHRLLRAGGLTRYYELRRGPGLPPVDLQTRRTDHKWLELLEASREQNRADQRVSLDIQGMHCAACVWLLEELFRRHSREDPGSIHINPALGRIELRVGPGFGLTSWVQAVEELGYLLGPARASSPRPSDEMLVRVGICTALSANAMIFATAIYLGLASGPVYELLNQLIYAAGVLSVLVGGSVFIRSAWAALRQRVLHLDVPIALGVVLAFAGSTWSFFFDSGRADYVDTLTVFVALMLLGRWLQQRMLEHNRAQLLTDDGVQSLLTRRLEGPLVQIVPCVAVAEKDKLLIAPGDLVPVDLQVGEAARCSLDWIDGESRPRHFPPGSTVPAGAFNVGQAAFLGSAAMAFSASAIVGLVGTQRGDSQGPVSTAWWSRLSRYYVLAVLTLAAGGMTLWWMRSGDVALALQVGTAVLVVTCPCAFGIATPLAYELVMTALRRMGIFIRVGDLLDRIRATKRIVFDKTGTLTSGTLSIVNAEALAALTDAERSVLYNLTVRSGHPKSVAVRRLLEGRPGVGFESMEVREELGSGLETRHRGKRYRLGAPGWAAAKSVLLDAQADLCFSVDSELVALLRTGEELRPGATEEIAALQTRPYQLAILSGDAPEHVRELGAALGMAEEDCLGAQSPEQKAAYIAARDPAHSLFVGDGLNDRAAMDVASCSATPAVNRPFMASRCDFYFVSPGLGAIAQTLQASEALARVVRRVLGFAIAYNALTVSLALAGLMRPWVAAVLMPLSSIATIAYTLAALSRKDGRWRS